MHIVLHVYYYLLAYMYVLCVRYNLVREAKKPSHVKLDQKTNEELKTQTKLICDVSTSILSGY